ncbi:uncharacterized protein LOC108830766 isoform X2 [Raphanus sativus]|uniref:Uncharacterized protein LOC108830766 isoform X2 n=1 Tax=Raphanus sativus TaxID=3726 RepID=A0A9W3DIG6_RAPSA|nr:uncharacterized protein LOC108830766 isoform X2 [Raphanus sativus]
MSPLMSLAIKLFIVFLWTESSMAKHVQDHNVSKNQNMSDIDYSSFFKQMIEGWLREADTKYPFRPKAMRTGKAQAYVREWNNWKPYRNLVNKIDVLWPNVDYECPPYEATNLLTYMLHGLSRRNNILRFLK